MGAKSSSGMVVEEVFSMVKATVNEDPESVNKELAELLESGISINTLNEVVLYIYY